MPPDMRQGLQSEFHFSDQDIAKVESGKAVAKIAQTSRPDDVRMAGVVLIQTSAEEFVKAFKDIEHFAASRDVVWTRRFSLPPKESDLALVQSPSIKDDLQACRPGRCSLKLPAADMKAIQSGVDWNAPDANQQVVALVRQRILLYLNNYREKGDPSLAVYYDTESPYSVADGLHSLIGSETRLGQVVPQLVRYASDYPADRPANTEDFFYIQEAAFGLKHVLRTEHVLLQKVAAPNGGDPHYAIISKMLFASHYFRAGVEFQYIYPVKQADGKPAIYLLSAQRSYVDGMTGAKGAIVRRVAEGRSPARLAENLQQAKDRLEHR